MCVVQVTVVDKAAAAPSAALMPYQDAEVIHQVKEWLSSQGSKIKVRQGRPVKHCVTLRPTPCKRHGRAGYRVPLCLSV
jgi:hypothetical protein